IAFAFAVFRFEAFALEAEGAARIGAGRQSKLHRAIEGRHAHLAAKRCFVKRDRQIEPQIGAIRLEQRVRRDVHRDQRIARLAARARPALLLQPDLLSACDAGRNLDLDVFPGGEVDAFFRALGCFGECDGECGVEVLPGGGGAEILRSELRAHAGATACTAAPRAAEHVAQDVLEAAPAAAAKPTARAAACALEAVGAEAEAFEMRTPRPTGARAAA